MRYLGITAIYIQSPPFLEAQNETKNNGLMRKWTPGPLLFYNSLSRCNI